MFRQALCLVTLAKRLETKTRKDWAPVGDCQSNHQISVVGVVFCFLGFVANNLVSFSSFLRSSAATFPQQIAVLWLLWAMGFLAVLVRTKV